MYTYPKVYDVIVVGGGHAGIEAALASARLGCSTLMLTMNCDTIGQMSCNPAIGGLAKGHLVREIDALGGEMGKTTDMTGLQFRMLNRKKGPSVWAPRAQCDKRAYQQRMKWVCECQPNLDLKQAQTTMLLLEGSGVCGVATSLEVAFRGRSVVVTAGTFLRGLMHIGANRQTGGRAGESSAESLTDSLRQVGLELGRMKTGTPPRLLKGSIDFSRLERQDGDEPVPWFSFWREGMFHVEHCGKELSTGGDGGGRPSLPGGGNNPYFRTRGFPGFPRSDGPLQDDGGYLPGSILAQIGGQLPCYITYTSSQTAELIRSNLHRSPLYGGVIEGVGPRYCPSIEDKIVRFADKERHQIFLEPEGIATDEIYVNGLSTSLPIEVQTDLVRSVGGCESAEILRPAYAVEYDFVPPTQLTNTLETKTCQNLFLAGQINGTSGYEEAAAQGLVAGINAALRVLGRPAFTLKRHEAYIGVLIDDLITKGTQEPYRMFTSRAEHRLVLRQDNADLRLCEIGHQLGLLGLSDYQRFRHRRDAVEAEIRRLRSTRSGGTTLAQLLRRPEITYESLPECRPELASEVARQVEIAIKYEGYIAREESEIERSRSLEAKAIPADFPFEHLPSLRREAREKLMAIRPTTVGQASRISGVNPSDISILMVWLKRHAGQGG